MDYKEKYEQALERAKTLYNSVFVNNDILEQIFPELEESEDERMRKQLLNWFKDCSWDTIDDGNLKREDIIAWLEKQGEQKYVPDWMPKFLDELRSKKNYFDWDEDKDIEASILAIIKWMNPNYFNEKDGEQSSADKVKPKFKVGDWVVYCNEDVDLIMGVEKTGYIINKGGGYIPFVCEDDMRLWTIEDAKDGDVLSYNDGHGNDCIELIKSITDKKIEFWFCLTNGNQYEVFDGVVPYTNLASREDAAPATKEQRELLFQKMKEAGYEWDSEKKELKKIEQKTAEWSEEDEKESKRVVGLLEGWLSTFQRTCYAEDCKCGISWLKSLKRRLKV